MRQLLKKSRENNRRRHLTGLLLYRNGFFMQALEGAEDEVGAVLEKISRDLRHTNLKILRESVSSERLFPDWSMGFENLDQADRETLDGFNNFLQQPLHAPAGSSANDAIRFLNLFRIRTAMR